MPPGRRSFETDAERKSALEALDEYIYDRVLLSPDTSAALVGSYGPPGETNRFVTSLDPRMNGWGPVQGPPGADGAIGPPGPAGDSWSQGPHWTNASRPVNPGVDLVGYNTEEKRPECYVLVDSTWYYLWQAPVGVVPPTAPSIFSDDFETGWLVPGAFTPLFADVFETGWFVDHTFGQLFLEDFEGTW